ncbi:MAG: nucleotidyltransferase family protein [Actinomycetota bacterium]|nr:nucleotidyltransferase family protein [Actinomycetota bacterium]
MTTAAVVLAAGGGSRFEGPVHKLLTPFRGRALASWALDAASRAGLDELIVVTGAVDLAGVLPADAHVVSNPRWDEGQATSVRVALDAAGARGHDAVVIGLADQPLVPAEAWRRVGGCDSHIAVATYDGRRRNPVRLASSVWSLVASTGDEGARTVIRLRPDLVTEVACPGDPGDVDTLEDLDRWN